MVKISKFGEDFLLLALRIDKHINGYIDFYIGPEKLKQIVENEPLTAPKKLLDDCKNLKQQSFYQGFSKEREKYLMKLLIAMETSIEILTGKDVPIEEQFLKLYDVTLHPIKEEDLILLKENIMEAYPGTNTLEEKMKRLSALRMVPKSKIIKLFEEALKITKERTKEIFKNLLPEGEKININLVDDSEQNLKWSYYEWYQGNFKSQLDINPNYEIYWTSFLSVAAHEGYPGHHTEFVIKEKELYQELNHFEQAILFVHSPRLIISEGIADTAINILFNYQEQAEISLLKICPNVLEEDTIDALTAQNKVRGKMTQFLYNFAYHALIDNWSEEKLIKYGRNFEIYNDKNLYNQLKMIYNPVYSKNAFMYNIGKNLILNKYSGFPNPKQFRDLLVNPILPSDLV